MHFKYITQGLFVTQMSAGKMSSVFLIFFLTPDIYAGLSGVTAGSFFGGVQRLNSCKSLIYKCNLKISQELR